MSDIRKLAQDIGAAPLGDLISSVGQGVAEAQAALDAGSLEQTLALYEQGDDLQKLMRETGYRPTFYTIPETEGELKLSMTVTGRQAARRPAPKPLAPNNTAMLNAALLTRSKMIAPKVYASPVDGRYQNSFNYSSEVSAIIKFKIVAVPPPSQTEEIRVVPDFSGLSVSDALALADSFDLGLEGAEDAVENANIATQDPAPGSLTTAGSLIAVTAIT